MRAEYCENSSRQAQRPNTELQACLDNAPSTALCVVYNHAECDLLFLCDDCVEQVTQQARSHGYETERRALP